MAKVNPGYNSSDMALGSNIQGQVMSGQSQGQPPYGQQPGQQQMYGQQQGQQQMYGQPPGQQQMYGQPPFQQQMYGQQQGQPPVYGQPQRQQMMYNQQFAPQRPEYWMPQPIVTGCPPGLEYLSQIDQLLVKQRIEVFEMITGYEMNNKYDVKNSLGQTMYKAKEETDFCERYWCGPNRRFKIHIFDNLNHEIMELKREHRCHRERCGQDEITVESPPGVIIGYVKHRYHGCKIHYVIMDAKENIVLRISGPGPCHCYCPGDDIPFEVLSAAGDIEVGRISKQWSNLVQEYFTDADNFGIQFPIDLDVKMKAVVLGAVFLIDFNYFETSGRRRQHIS